MARDGVVLEVDAVSRNFGALNALTRVSLTVQQGQVFSVIGPNGAGKSTLLRILAGELGVDRGSVARRGGLRVAYLPQMPTFENRSPAPLASPSQAPVINGPMSQPAFRGMTGIGQ